MTTNVWLTQVRVSLFVSSYNHPKIVNTLIKQKMVSALYVLITYHKGLG